MSDLCDQPRQPVLVLGSSGFIGSRLVAALADHRQYRSVAASRCPAPGGRLVGATELAGFGALLTEAGYVVNCIAGSGRAMIDATRAICDAGRPIRQYA